MKSVLTLIIILFLITSSIPFGFADLQQTDVPIPQNLIDDFSAPKENRIISIFLHESMGIATNEPPKKNSMHQNNAIYISEDSEKFIFLSENLDITTLTNEQQIQINTFVIQPQAILDRVSQIDKVKDRKKNSKYVISDLDDTYQQDSSDDFKLIESPISQTIFFVGLPQIISNSVIDYNFENVLQLIIILKMFYN